jgi:hypothetical protein
VTITIGHTDDEVSSGLAQQHKNLFDYITGEFGPEFGRGDLEAVVRRLVMYAQDLRRMLYDVPNNSELGPLKACRDCEKGWHPCKPIEADDLPPRIRRKR